MQLAHGSKTCSQMDVSRSFEMHSYPCVDLFYFDFVSCSYVFGYYCTNSTELNLFEFLQEDLEKNVEYLQELVELREETHQ